MRRFVGQVANLRRIGNPPAALSRSATATVAKCWRLAAHRGRRISNPPQVNNLPHKEF